MTQDLMKGRLLSLDFMRGLIMVLLMFESVGLYENFHEVTEGYSLQLFLNSFFTIRGMVFGFGT